MDNKTVRELKQICRENDFRGFSRYSKKEELLNFLDKNLQKKDSDADAELAKLIYESEQEYFQKKQKEEIIKQHNEILRKKKAEDEKRIYEENLVKKEQNELYEKALQEDLRRQEEEKNKIEMEKYKLEKDRLYSLNITGEELNNMRLARLARFN